MFYFVAILILTIFVLMLRSDLKKLRAEFEAYKKKTNKSLWDLQESDNEEGTTVDDLPELELPKEQPPAISSVTPVKSSPAPVRHARKPQAPQAPKEPSWSDKVIQEVITYFKTGNTMVKVGTVILFFGVSFLVKLAMENGMFPPAMRLTCSGILGLIMLVYGWKQRIAKRNFGLTLQGGGLGIFYITIFAAMKMYFFVPPAVGFVFLILFSFGGGYLSVLQDSRNLAIFSLIGGFAAPILASTGSGNYIVLFSYYIILNLAVLFVAFQKNWRILNLLAFVATYGVATVWGVLDFKAHDYVFVQPFLVGFFIIYLAIPVIFAVKDPKDYIDGTLIFGNPIISFSLQLGLVDGRDYGAAISSMCLGFTYLMMARNFQPRIKILSEVFLAIGVIFASLTIPLALDPEVTAGIYALEASAVYWISVRQKRMLGRYFSTFLLCVSIFFFLIGAESYGKGLPFFNANFFSSAFIVMGCYFYSWVNHIYKALIPEGEQWTGKFSLWIGWLWVGIALFSEWVFIFGTHSKIPDNLQEYALFGFLVSTGLVAFTLFRLGIKGQYRDFIEHSISYPMALLVAAVVVAGSSVIPSDAGGGIFFPLLFGYGFFLLKQSEKFKPMQSLQQLSHSLLSYVAVYLAVYEITHHVTKANIGAGWFNAAVLLPLLVFGLIIYHPVTKTKWPIFNHKEFYRVWILGPMTVIGALVVLGHSIESAGSIRPLSIYIPILNPMEMAHVLVLVLFATWLKQFIKSFGWKAYSVIIGGLSFIWVNSVLYRAIHHYSSLPYKFNIMFDSSLVQTITSIYWALIGIGLILLATRRQIRWIWITGASFMGLVAVKLFMIDLSHTNTIERVISFIVVGVIFVLIGYFSPIPAEKKETA